MRWQAVWLTFAAACSGESDTAGDVLFEDDFSGSFPEPLWAGDGMLDPSAGRPAPALDVVPVAPQAMAVAQTTNPIELRTGWTFSFDATNVPDLATSNVNIVDVSYAEAVHVTFRPQTISYHIQGNPAASMPITPDTEFHSYMVHVAADGATTWHRDGVLQHEGHLDDMPTLARLVVRSDRNGIVIDNVSFVSD